MGSRSEPAVLVCVVTFKDNVKTGALPGGLIRNPRTQHVRDAGAVSTVDIDFVMAQRGPATRPLIGRGDAGGRGVELSPVRPGRDFGRRLAVGRTVGLIPAGPPNQNNWSVDSAPWQFRSSDHHPSRYAPVF